METLKAAPDSTAGGPANMDLFFALEYQNALVRMAKEDNTNWEKSIRRIAKADAETLKVERVSVWLYNRNRSEIVCECLYKLSEDACEKGQSLRARDFPRYFEAMEENRTVAADNAQTDLRTSEFTEVYLKPLDITSMMDVPVRLHGKVIGVVCHEHTGPLREWTLGDQDFAASVADLVSLAYEADRRRRAETELRKLKMTLVKENKKLKSLLKKTKTKK